MLILINNLSENENSIIGREDNKYIDAIAFSYQNFNVLFLTLSCQVCNVCHFMHAVTNYLITGHFTFIFDIMAIFLILIHRD